MSEHSITIFRSRLRPGIREEYAAVANRMEALAQTMPGFISIDTYEAADGNRVSIVEFASHETAQTWRRRPNTARHKRWAARSSTRSTAFRSGPWSGSTNSL
jgi:antibiotic biosynthesis monooxygenase (ABM) superfamily enzyme